MKPGIRVLGPCKGGGVKVMLGRNLRKDPELVVKIVEQTTGVEYFAHEGKLRKRSIHCKDVPNGTRVVVAAIGQYNTGSVTSHGIELVAPVGIEIESSPQVAASPGANQHPSVQRPTPKALATAVRNGINGKQVL